MPTPGTVPPLAPGVRRIVEGSHRATGSRLDRGGGPEGPVPTSAEPAAEVDERGRAIPEVRPEELDGGPWLEALLWHRPEEAPFPGAYGIVVQPFLASSEQTGYRDGRGRPLTYLLLFVTGLVGRGRALDPPTVQAAFHDTVARATALAKGLSQEMGDASVRLLLARMPEWMARKLLPGVRDVRRV